MTSKTTPDFPWSDLQAPLEPGKYTARLVAPEINPTQKGLYWARGWLGRPALLVEYVCDNWAPIELPEFRNLCIEDHEKEKCVTVELLDLSMSEIFKKVCLDLISFLQEIDDRAARQACVFRLEKWSILLRPSHNRMTPEEQKGLIAELHILRSDFLTLFDTREALQGWVGPDSEPRDFVFGQSFIEVKSKRSSANSCITVSSESQLSTRDDEQLFIFVEELNPAPTDDANSFTLTDVVTETESCIHSPLHRADFEAKLAKVGYFDSDNYDNDHWTKGACSYYFVDKGFPRIEAKSCPPGVRNISYQIDLDYCLDYKVERSVFLKSLEL
jgi:hypothetical protein